MRSFHKALTAALAFVASGVLASPIVATPGGAEDIVITEDNTVNATQHYKLPIQIAAATTPTAGQLNLSFVNNLASDNVNAYITGLDSNGQLVMLYPNGSWYYPTADNSGIPQPITADVAIPLGPKGSAIQISLPGYLTAGRIWFADGDLKFFTVMGGNGPALVEPSAVNPSDPSAAVNWGFVELTWTPNGGIYANISYVDFVGLPMGMYLNTTDGNDQSALGVTRDAVAEICADLAAQTAIDGQPWDSLCVTDSKGTPLRVLSPTQYLSINNSAWSTYWDNYIDQVWDHYTANNLTINTQAAAGLVNCSVINETMYCAGDNRGYAKPTATDLFGCNGGPFSIQGGDNPVHYAVVPRLCAAFHRTTLSLAGGNVQPALNSSHYYTESPTNFYSKTVHNYEVDGKGYAFAYDDVTPDGAINDSGLLADPNPMLLAITIGGPVADPPSITTSTVSSSMVSTTMSQSSATIESSSSSISTTQSSSVTTTSISSSATLSSTSLLSNTSMPAVGTIVKTTSSSTSSSLVQTTSSLVSSSSSSASTSSSSLSSSSSVSSSSSSSASQVKFSSTTSSASTKITSVKSSSSSSSSFLNGLVTETVTQTTQAETTTTALTTFTMSPVLSTSSTSSSAQSTASQKPKKKKRPHRKHPKKPAAAKTTIPIAAVSTSAPTASTTPTRRTTVTQMATVTHTPTTSTTPEHPEKKHKKHPKKKHPKKKGKKHHPTKATTTTSDPAATAPAMTTLKKVVSQQPAASSAAPATPTAQETQYSTPTSLYVPFATKAIQVLKLFADGTWAWGQ
ncbi:hypothetical protein MBLNU457_7113t2 [Dothideomycetes sp. NU457]